MTSCAGDTPDGFFVLENAPEIRPVQQRMFLKKKISHPSCWSGHQQLTSLRRIDGRRMSSFSTRTGLANFVRQVEKLLDKNIPALAGEFNIDWLGCFVDLSHLVNLGFLLSHDG